MVETRWLRWVGPGIVALAGIVLIGSATVGAGTRTWSPGPCAGSRTDETASARETIPGTPHDLAAAPWFRLDPVAADDGSLRGERLVLGLFGDALTRTLDLPAEAFAAGPFGGTVLTGADDGSTSRLELVDVARGCSWVVATERDVIRRATVDADGASVYEMRVDRATRADLGIWRRSLRDASSAERILAPISADARFGITFSTELAWDLAGDRLVVQSCGEFACRTRIFDPHDGAVATLDAPDLGLLVGVDGDRVVTYADCHGLPCPIISTNLATDTRTVVAEAAGAATLVRGASGAAVVIEQDTASGHAVRSIALDGSDSSDAVSVPPDLELTGTPWSGTSSTRLPPGWVLLAPDGRLSGDPNDHRSQLRHIPDGTTVQLDEATR
ncbi:MAG: hypothetical protein ACJ77C_11780 [Chloroflexota bacterium]